MKKTIHYGAQFIFKNDINFIKKSLQKNLITTGPYVKHFEDSIKSFLKVKYVSACSSGTSALHLVFMAIDLNKEDNIILPSINFIAAASMANFCRANIFFCDIDPDTGQISATLIEKCIKENRLKKIKAIINMYNGGYPRNMYDIHKLKKKYSCFLIEDACHAFGGSYIHDKKKYLIGSCRHSDFSTFSFHPLKTITTGEGSCVTTKSKLFSDRINELRSHGIKKSKKNWSYDIERLSFNYRISDINCALGISQLKKIKLIIKKRTNIFKQYYKNLNNYLNCFEVISPSPKTFSAFHLVLLKINFKFLSIDKELFLSFLKKKGINCQQHYIPNYKFKVFKKKFSKKKMSGAENYFNSVISLPIHLNINKDEQKKIIKLTKSIAKKYLKV